jgi:hypothetical protein
LVKFYQKPQKIKEENACWNLGIVFVVIVNEKGVEHGKVRANDDSLFVLHSRSTERKIQLIHLGPLKRRDSPFVELIFSIIRETRRFSTRSLKFFMHVFFLFQNFSRTQKHSADEKTERI